jgi:glucose/arabinose dehydrogenase
MTFMPDGRLLVTDNQAKTLSLTTQTGTITTVAGLPVLGGIYDIALSPAFATNKTIYFTFAEPSPPGTPRDGPYAYPDYVADPKMFSGVLALATAQLDESTGAPVLRSLKVVWRQTPQIVSGGEFGGRIAFSPDRSYVFVTVGDRAVYPPAKSLDNTLGKIIRLKLDGSIPADNPFVNTAGALGEIWSLGHRNPYGLAFAPDGRLWESEHGPKGGDELNLVKAGANYGWPAVSSGDGYDGTPMPRPAAGDGFAASAYIWTPAIPPAGMIFYDGAVFGDWRGDILLTGLVSKALIRMRVAGETAKEMQRFDIGGRVREVEQGPDGSLWLLIDSPNGKLVKLAPVF